MIGNTGPVPSCRSTRQETGRVEALSAPRDTNGSRHILFHDKKRRAQNINSAFQNPGGDQMDPKSDTPVISGVQRCNILNASKLLESMTAGTGAPDKDEPTVAFVETRIDDSQPTTLFVTNVPYDLDEAGLTAEFGKHDIRVKTAKIYRAQRRHRGIGCVVVHPEDYDQAVELHKKIRIHDRCIRIEPFKPKDQRGRQPPLPLLPPRMHEGGEAFFSTSVTLVEWYVVQLFRTLRSQGVV
ncbi:hypothetical protein B0H11DRAFT_1902372 [Mycena galericulata]|nr:hypothetical protein B0H11DRAFT_1902372 [Mycena galericulata]